MIWPALGHAAVMAACAGGAGGRGAPPALPQSTLAVRSGATWQEWWRSDRAPGTYAGGGVLAQSLAWTRGAPGVEVAEAELKGRAEAWRTRLVVVRLDLRLVRISLDTASAGGAPAWTVERARTDAVVATNAGQFIRTMPWGWVVLDGRQFLAPATAPLVTTVTVDRTGAVRFTHGALPDSAGVRWAFQSFPTLIAEGAIPEPLRQSGCGIDVAHRDARLALGLDRDGRLLIAMTRFDGLAGALDRIPFGLTTPEMAAVIGSLGASEGVMLDGGISAQLMVRDADGTARPWPGTRKVPLGLVAMPR